MGRLDVAAVKAHASLAAIAGQFITLKQQGTKLIGLCPLHDEKTPSFNIDPEQGLWHCFGCGKGGDAITLVKEIENLTFTEAVRKVAELSGYPIEPNGIPPPPVASAPIGKVTATYRYLDENRQLLYEIQRIEPGRNGRRKDFSQRYWDENGQIVWRKHPRQVLYRLPEVLASDMAILVEGEKDCDNLALAGFVATTNAGGCEAKWLDEYTQALTGKRVIVIPDNDPNGMKHMETAIKALSGKAAAILLLILPLTEKGADASDYLNLHSPEELRTLIERGWEDQRRQRLATKGLLLPIEAIELYEGGENAFLDPSKRNKGLSTGFSTYDSLTQGLHPGELTIVAARPAMGKSAFVINVAAHIAGKLGKTVDFFSLEMSRLSIYGRLICGLARVNSQKYRMGLLNQSERLAIMRAWTEISHWNLRVDDSCDVTLEDMASKLENADSPSDLVIVDYLQLMNTKGKQQNRNEEVGILSRGLKKLSKQRNVPIIALSQLSRAVEGRAHNRPQLSDLRESGAIEQDADVVNFIFREEVYKKDRQDLKGVAELIIAKQRNGETGMVPLVWLAGITKFENRAENTEWSQHNDE